MKHIVMLKDKVFHDTHAVSVLVLHTFNETEETQNMHIYIYHFFQIIHDVVLCLNSMLYFLE